MIAEDLQKSEASEIYVKDFKNQESVRKRRLRISVRKGNSKTS